MRVFIAVAKLLRALGHIVYGLLLVSRKFPKLTQEQRSVQVQLWALDMLTVLGIVLRVEGLPPAQGPMLLVANHISWLDILVIHASRHCRFVSKSEVRHWPLIGTLASGAGTLFIERESRRDAMRVVHHMTDSLRAGDILAVFPEGTTSDGLQLLTFHGNLIQAAISAHVEVQPVALRFLDSVTQQTSLAPCYIDDDTLVGSIWKTLSAPRITAVIRFGEPEQAKGRDRRVWAAALREYVEKLRTHGGGS